MPSGRDSFRRNRIAPLVRVYFSMFDDVRIQPASLENLEDPSPLGFFLEVFILKGFKSCVLEVRILNGLGAHFP